MPPFLSGCHSGLPCLLGKVVCFGYVATLVVCKTMQYAMLCSSGSDGLVVDWKYACKAMQWQVVVMVLCKAM